MCFWGAKSISLKNSLPIGKWLKSQEVCKFWLKDNAQFNMNRYAILNIALNFANKQFVTLTTFL